VSYPPRRIYVERGPADDPEATAAAVEGLVGWVAPVAERHRGRLVVSLRDAGRYLPALAEDRATRPHLQSTLLLFGRRKSWTARGVYFSILDDQGPRSIGRYLTKAQH